MRCRRRVSRTALISLAFVLCIAGLAACAPQSAGQSTGSNGTESGQSTSENTSAVDFEWSVGSDCTTCHTNQAESLGNAECLAGAHGTSLVECATCHNTESELTSIHATATADKAAKLKRLRQTAVSNETCLTSGCHDLAETAQKTASLDLLTDDNGRTVNPHDLPENEDHATILCADCHTAHEAQVTADNAPETCKSCHHKNVYECGTCHE